uniref:Uncharacterized protein n=1 Tax=Streptomyces avermitilis TaxID=33903 RepID=A0A499VT68_STRAX|nr:hypothetical protein SAVMC3_79570 [Streptomyces avermitilis]
MGFDRSMALASSALTTLLPLAVLGGTVVSSFAHYDAAERVIKRYGLTGAGAEAVESLFSPAQHTSASVGIFGVVFLTISVLSFARATQRLFEQTWELKPLSMRNTRNGLWWILTLGGYTVVTGWLSAVLGGGRLGLAALVCDVPVTAAFLVWSGWILSAKRINRPDLLPFGIAAALLEAAYSVGTTVYLPRLFNSYAARYGALGAVFAMISALFGGCSSSSRRRHWAERYATSSPGSATATARPTMTSAANGTAWSNRRGHVGVPHGNRSLTAAPRTRTVATVPRHRRPRSTRAGRQRRAGLN